jgi:hypothetical protein
VKKEIKEQWTAALESGDYAQGKSELRTAEDSYCCLGVLCDLAVQAGIAKWERRNFHGSDVQVWFAAPVSGDAQDSDSTFLPKFVKEWAGLDDTNPTVPDPTEPDHKSGLAMLNDDGVPFTKIADRIKEHL